MVLEFPVTAIAGPEMWAILNAVLIFAYGVYRAKVPKDQRDDRVKAFIIIYTLGLWMTMAGTLFFKTQLAIPRICDPCLPGHLEGCNPYCPTDPQDYAFPSGHASTAFAALMPFWFVFRRKGAWALAIPVIVAFSRVLLGVHTPIDVLGGVALGIFASWIAWRLYKTFFTYD